jgi:hypothetical protein
MDDTSEFLFSVLSCLLQQQEVFKMQPDVLPSCPRAVKAGWGFTADEIMLIAKELGLDEQLLPKFLVTLFVLKNNLSWDAAGIIYGVPRATAHRWVSDFLAAVRPRLIFDETIRFQETRLAFPFEHCTMLVDGFPVFTGQSDGGGNYSGKYKRSGYKFQMITSLSGIPINLSPAQPAKKHDALLYAETDMLHEPWEMVLGDKAYISQPHCVAPPKKNQKVFKDNPTKARVFIAWHRLHRAKVEHCFARMHRFRFMKYSHFRKIVPRAVRLIAWCDHVTLAHRAKLHRWLDPNPHTITRAAECNCMFLRN